VEDGTITTLHTAFSREGDSKVYVTHRLEEQADTVWRVLSEEAGHIYVCGATNMGHDVHSILQRLAERRDCGAMGEEAAKAWVKGLQSEERYVQELWSA
jgi:NADPH-ferrihemoprotein reductase